MVRLLAFYKELHWNGNMEIEDVEIEFDAPIQYAAWEAWALWHQKSVNLLTAICGADVLSGYLQGEGRVHTTQHSASYINDG